MESKKSPSRSSLPSPERSIEKPSEKPAEKPSETSLGSTRLTVLSQRGDFLSILKTGQRLRPSAWLLMSFIESPVGRLRCGWTLPRQVGPAVVRNRLKRWSRVYFRNRIKDDQTLPIDINLIFRKTEGDFYKKLSYERFASVVDKGWNDLARKRTALVLAQTETGRR